MYCLQHLPSLFLARSRFVRLNKQRILSLLAWAPLRRKLDAREDHGSFFFALPFLPLSSGSYSQAKPCPG